MKYKKPEIIKLNGKLPPITTNFAPPPVENPGNPEEDPLDTPFLFNEKHKLMDKTYHNKKKIE